MELLQIPRDRLRILGQGKPCLRPKIEASCCDILSWKAENRGASLYNVSLAPPPLARDPYRPPRANDIFRRVSLIDSVLARRLLHPVSLFILGHINIIRDELGRFFHCKRLVEVPKGTSLSPIRRRALEKKNSIAAALFGLFLIASQCPRDPICERNRAFPGAN